MANETILAGRYQVVAKVETTEGADVSPAVGTDDIWFESFSWSYDQDQIQRTGIANRRSGVKDAVGAAHLSWQGSKDIQMKTIASGIASEAPECDPLLRCCGFTRVLGGSTDDTITYFLTDDKCESATIKVLDCNHLDNDQNKATLLGARGNVNISFEAGDTVKLEASGMAVPHSTVANNVTVTGSAATGSVYSEERPLVAKGVNTEIVDLANAGGFGADSLYGAGTLGSPSNQVDVLSLSIDLGLSPVEHMGISAGAGVKRIKLDATAKPTASLVVEQTMLNDWSPYVLRDAAAAIECDFTFTQPGASANTLQIVFYAQIVGTIDQGDQDGRKTWGLSLVLLYPEDHDGDPVAGVSAAQLLEKSGTANSGLGDDTNITALASSLALQFRTS